MAGFTDTYENGILNLFFRATAIANIADNAASAPESNLEISLHTGDPGDTGDMTTNEADYTSYARETIARSTGFGAASGGSIALASDLDFTESTGSGTTMTHFGVGKASAGDTLYISGAISPTIAVGASGIIPRLTTSTTISLD